MKPIAKISTGLLFAWAFICLTVTVAELRDRDVKRWQKAEAQETILSGIALGVPALLGGLWLVGEAATKKRDRLRSVFYRQLQKNNGRVTTLQLAMAAQISGVAAKRFLDRQARDFSASFEVTKTGEVIYAFYLESSEDFSAIASDIPSPKKHKKHRRKHNNSKART